jgi:phenylalanine-4-hydroxylase
VSARLEPLTGFRYVPAAGLVPLDEFYGSLADRVFHSTQYIRHPAAPLYTPEPDLIHEVIGHGNLLASPELAELNLLAGRAARRCETDEGLRFLARVFWFTIEFGVLWENGELRAYGAGILSSYGEIEEFREMEIRPIDYLEMGTIDYDITHYQPVLYSAESMTHLVDSLGDFLAGFDDDTPERLRCDPEARGAHVPVRGPVRVHGAH